MSQNVLGVLSAFSLSLIFCFGWKYNQGVPSIDEIFFVEGKIERTWLFGLNGGSFGFRIENQSYRGPAFLKDKLLKGDFVEVGITNPERKELYKTVYILKHSGQQIVSFNHEVSLRKSLSKILGWASVTCLVLAIVFGAHVYQAHTKK